MNNTVPAQHPAVVLRSAYVQLRALLAIATVAIVGLTVAVLVLAISSDGSATINSPARVSAIAVHVVPAAAIAPNPDQRGANPATRAGSKSIRSTSSPVEPNPDQR